MLPLLLLTTAAGPADHFEAKVRPALVEHCHKCHAADKHKGGLRLDSRAALLAGGDTGPALVPGDVENSLLVKAVRGHDPDLVMPPTGKLPDAVVRDFEAWVRDGAAWPGDSGSTTKAAFDLAGRKASHWAWQPLRDPPGDLDGFVRAKLSDKGLSPAPAADPAALVRRLAFDLTGLPPTVEEAERFAADPSPAAYAKLVDGYLSSVHFGERWGRHWLDVVRYADSRGHEFDFPIPYAWRYRDWVIRTFNADLPLKRFLTEQLAGDRVGVPEAAGFWLLGEELHSPVDVRQDQADRFDNRLDVFGKAVLGLTVACARCHDHKFDAISAKDYYGLFALLEASVPTLARLDAAGDGAVATKLSDLRRTCKLEAPARVSLTGGERRTLAGASGLQVVVDYANLRPGDWLADGPGWGTGPVPAGGVVFEPHPTPVGRAAAVSDRLFDALAIDGPERVTGKLHALRPGLVLRTPDFTVTTGKVFALVRGGGTSYAAVGHHFLVEGPLHGGLVTEWKPRAEWRWECHDLTAYRGQTTHLQLWPTPGQVLAVAAVVQAESAPPLPPAEPVTPLDPAEAERLETGYAALAGQLTPRSPVALTLWEGTPRPGRVFVRGSPKAPGDAVPPRLLEALGGTKPLTGRLELAELVTDPAVSPLTYRTAANRIWGHLFGRGLVPSPDNLGVLGEPPSHPELLDWLASRLVTETPKQVIRRIVLSDTYRQSAREVAAAEVADPDDVLLHRQRLRRLESEAIRDSLLSLSGRLDRTPFGPPVPVFVGPHQDGRGKPVSGPLDGAGRRTVYVSVRRNFLSPFQLAFDAPNPFGPVGRRTVSNVPAQALALMNDDFVHQQAAAWAERVKDIDQLYLGAFARRPTAAERAACERFVSAGDWAGLGHALVNVKEFVYR